ncbi:MAG: hypothetical protein PHD32_03760 [Eubacteriales bacterium]|nr:hypothetical protein [Eubacteriales bacterium]
MKKRMVFFLALLFTLALAPAALAGKESTPKLIVSAYAMDTDALEPGTPQTLRVTVRNTSLYQDAQQVKLRFKSATGIVMSAGVAAQYVETIKKGEEYTWEVAIFAAEDAPSGYSSADITMDYEGKNGAGSETDSIMLRVEQPLRVECGTPVLAQRMVQGDSAAFSMDVMNLGKTAIYNATLRLNVPGLSEGGSLLLGNLEAGETKSGKTTLTAYEPSGGFGETSGTVTLSYEDAKGATYQETLALGTVIEKKQALGIQQDTPKKEGLSPWIYTAIAVVVMGSAVIWVQVALARKRRRDMDEQRL